MARRVEPGTIFELSTRQGLAYGQTTHLHPQWGALVRMYRGFFGTRPDLRLILDRDVQFKTFFPLAQAVRAKIATVVGEAEVPAGDRPFPLFRAPGPTDREGRIHGWWLWDGQKEWKIGRLTATQRRYPIREVINDTLLIERLESGWSPETDKSPEA